MCSYHQLPWAIEEKRRAGNLREDVLTRLVPDSSYFVSFDVKLVYTK